MLEVCSMTSSLSEQQHAQYSCQHINEARLLPTPEKRHWWAARRQPLLRGGHQHQVTKCRWDSAVLVAKNVHGIVPRCCSCEFCRQPCKLSEAFRVGQRRVAADLRVHRCPVINVERQYRQPRQRLRCKVSPFLHSGKRGLVVV